MSDAWVCPECGVDYGTLKPPFAINTIRSFPRRYTEALAARPGEDIEQVIRTRPQPDVWSALEYTGHSSDLMESFADVVKRMYDEDKPTLDFWDPDERTAGANYNGQATAEILARLKQNCDALIAQAERVDSGGWSRTATFPWGERDLLTMLQNAVHEGVHHLKDVEDVLPRCARETDAVRSALLFARGSALVAVGGVVIITTPAVYAAPVAAAPIPVVVVSGRGHGHGVGMAQDGALAMGLAGATARDILGQFYPGTAIGKAGGPVRVPVFTGNSVQLGFPDGGQISGAASSPMKFAPGSAALIYRDGGGTRVKTIVPPPPPRPSTTTTSTSSTTTTTIRTTTTTGLLHLPPPKNAKAVAVNATTTSAPPTTTSTTTPPVLFTGVLNAVPTGNGRVAVAPRGHQYRGTIEMAPVPGGVRFVNQVDVETYLRGMGEVRDPNWPAASLQSQAIAERTYALRAMGVGGELCDTQRCQVYVGSEAEYAQMDKAIAATTGQVLTWDKGLASAVYSANGGGHSASREEGFGLAGPSYPYLRAAPYLTNDPDPWAETIALRDVAQQLHYRGEVTSVVVTQRGASGRATRVELTGSRGTADVTGLAFASAVGLQSTLFSVQITTATKVSSIHGGTTLQAPPDEAPALATGQVDAVGVYTSGGVGASFVSPSSRPRDVAGPAVAAAVLWIAVAVSALRSRQRGRAGLHALLS